ncbi:MAG: hypothetical protein RL378_287 [Actinomycetota bacterium]
MAKSSFKTGGILAGAGCVFGIAPMAIMFAIGGIASVLGMDMNALNGLGVLGWFTFFTAPLGAVVVFVGLVTAIVGATKSTSSDFAESAMSTQGQAEAGGTGTPSNAKPVELPPLPPGLARTVKIAYAFGFVVVLVGCVMRVTVFQPVYGVGVFFDFVPVIFAGWFVFLARNAHEGLGFLRLYQSQLIVSIAGCVVALWPLVTLDTSLSLLEYDDSGAFQTFGTIITNFIPAVASLASLVFAGAVRAMYRRGLKAS